jgi:hypothetical protein
VPYEATKPQKLVKKTARIPLNIDKYNERQKSIEELGQNYQPHAHTFLNCDLRYFNLDFLVDKMGHFDGRLV